MSEGQASPAEPRRTGEPTGGPPRMVLYALYVVLVAVLIAVLVIVGVYGA